jgi:hypothetical protein
LLLTASRKRAGPTSVAKKAAEQLRSVLRRDLTQSANAIRCAKFFSRSDDALIRVYYHAGNVIETDKHKSDFKEW